MAFLLLFHFFYSVLYYKAFMNILQVYFSFPAYFLIISVIPDYYSIFFEFFLSLRFIYFTSLHRSREKSFPIPFFPVFFSCFSAAGKL